MAWKKLQDNLNQSHSLITFDALSYLQIDPCTVKRCDPDCIWPLLNRMELDFSQNCLTKLSRSIQNKTLELLTTKHQNLHFYVSTRNVSATATATKKQWFHQATQTVQSFPTARTLHLIWHWSLYSIFFCFCVALRCFGVSIADIESVHASVNMHAPDTPKHMWHQDIYWNYANNMKLLTTFDILTT